MVNFNDLDRCTRRASTEIEDCNILGVTVATNGYGGGDSGHGGRTYFCLEDLDSTDISARVTTDHFGYTQKVEIMLGGDAELETFIEALRWAADNLERLANEK